MDPRPCLGTNRTHPRITPVSDDPDYIAQLSTDRCRRMDHLNKHGLCTLHCPTCRLLDFDAVSNCMDRQLAAKIERRFNKHWQDDHGYPVFAPTSHLGNGTFAGPFAFTLTKSPADDLTEEKMLEAVRKVMNQKSCPVKAFAWFLEYGDPETKGHPHIHGMYETIKGGRIEAKHFKRAWPIWDERNKQGAGFRGGYHRNVRSEESYANYIAKDGGPSGNYNLPS